MIDLNAIGTFCDGAAAVDVASGLLFGLGLVPSPNSPPMQEEENLRLLLTLLNDSVKWGTSVSRSDRCDVDKDSRTRANLL